MIDQIIEKDKLYKNNKEENEKHDEDIKKLE